jgi:cysteine dioxygenase
MNRIIRSLRSNYNNLENSKHILHSYNSNDWKKYVNYYKETYMKNLIYKDKNIEMLLLCWLPGQQSKIHNHPKNGCLMKILQGNIKEITYDQYNGKILTKNLCPTNYVGYIDDSKCVHKMINNTENKCVTLHIYSPPNFIPTYLK